ncbi:hypothetical protein SteCoe_4206 [Stentor coeruleus]|uniref:Uncharacterized protein n=1 Tax=Stentor coeruleus TaxID=5963 RepID=A0A1R2CV29_9CILI|nr:hypothetical protein SteCoe_4206 [Stentor coeruleus]
MSSSSDDAAIDADEFWEESQDEASVRADSPIKVSTDYRRGATIRTNVSPSKFMFKQLTSIPEDFFKQRMEMSIHKLRQENDEQIKSVKLVVRNKTRKELKSAVDEIRAQFEKEVFLIKQEHDKMKEEISKKNKEIMLIAEYMIDQETMITQNRLQTLFKVEEVDKTAEIFAEEKQLKKDLGVLKVQIDAMKEAIKDYTNDTVQSASKVKELDQEIAFILSRNRQELKELEVYLEGRVTKAIEERDKIREEFETYKKSGWKELEDKEVSCKRQRDIIITLQSELKKAKSILNNPRLKLRVHERLKDYLDEYERESNESPVTLPNRSAIPSRRSRTIEKRSAFTSKTNYDYSAKHGSFNDNSTDFPKSQLKKPVTNDTHRSRLSES